MRREDGALLALAGAAAGVLAVRGFLIEPRRLAVMSHVVRSSAETRRTMRIVLLSDLHLRGIGTLERQILAAAADARPDLVAVAGDCITRRPALGALDRFVGSLTAIAPTYAVPGNWDRWSGTSIGELRSLFSRHGGRLLVNESIVLSIGDERVRLTGVDDLVSGTPSAREGLVAAREHETHILLAHCPGYREVLWREVAEHRASHGWMAGAHPPGPTLMLAGHTHGGQVRLLGWAPIRPAGSGRYLHGWYRDAAPHMYVTQGLGVSAVPARLGSTPELTVLDVELPHRL